MSKNLSFHNVGKRLSAKQLGVLEHLMCVEAPGHLPLAYRKFLLKYNGCRPEPQYFKWRNHDGEWMILEVFNFLEVCSVNLDEPGMDCIQTTLNYRSCLPRFAIPIANLDLDCLLLLFTAGPREGEVWRCSPDDANQGPWQIDPEKGISFVAKDFDAFLKLLHQPVVSDPYQPITIALDSHHVRGTPLEKILKGLGCTRYRYPGVIQSKPKLLPAWRWPKYENTEDVGGPAFLNLEKNKTYGYAPNFDERPTGHLMLRVNVTKLQRAKCLKELMDALGNGAVLLGDE